MPTNMSTTVIWLSQKVKFERIYSRYDLPKVFQNWFSRIIKFCMVLILIKNHGYIYRNTGCGVSRSGIQTQNTFTEVMAGITLGTPIIRTLFFYEKKYPGFLIRTYFSGLMFFTRIFQNQILKIIVSSFLRDHHYYKRY